MNWVISAFSLILSSWFHTPACVNFSFEFCVTVPNWWGPQTYYTCCILWQEIFCPTAEHWLVYQLYYVKGKEKKKREIHCTGFVFHFHSSSAENSQSL